MITKEQFLSAIEKHNAFDKFMDNLYDSGIDVYNNKQIMELLTEYINLISTSFGFLPNDDTVNWWFYEFNQGRNKNYSENEVVIQSEDLCITAKDLDTPEKAYDTFVKMEMSIHDKSK